MLRNCLNRVVFESGWGLMEGRLGLVKLAGHDAGIGFAAEGVSLHVLGCKRIVRVGLVLLPNVALGSVLLETLRL